MIIMIKMKGYTEELNWKIEFIIITLAAATKNTQIEVYYQNMYGR